MSTATGEDLSAANSRGMRRRYAIASGTLLALVLVAVFVMMAGAASQSRIPVLVMAGIVLVIIVAVLARVTSDMASEYRARPITADDIVRIERVPVPVVRESDEPRRLSTIDVLNRSEYVGPLGMACFFGSIAVVAMTSRLVTETRYLLDGAYAEARITTRQVATAKAPAITMTVEFATDSGRQVRSESKIWHAEYTQLWSRPTATLQYLRGDPTVNRVVGVQDAGPTSGIVGMGVLLFVIAAPLFAVVFIRARRLARVSHIGVAVEAIVTGVERAPLGSADHRHRLAYRYRTAPDVWRPGWSQHLSADEVAGLSRGHRGTVMFDPNEPELSLWMGRRAAPPRVPVTLPPLVEAPRVEPAPVVEPAPSVAIAVPSGPRLERVANGATLEHALDRPSVTIGRSFSCYIRLDDDSLAYEHARLDARDDGWVVTPRSALRGVTVNGESIATPRRVAEGDDIGLGTVHLTFRGGDR